MKNAFSRILIRGCPRSGNTMLYLMLCSCFENVSQIPGERIPVDALVKNRKKVSIAKYPRPITKKILGPYYEAGKEFIRTPPDDALLIFIVRDPRDALMSKHGSFGDQPFLQDAAGWFRVMDEINAVRDRDNVIVLRYEDIVLNADEVQEQIAAISGLNIYRKFSAFNDAIEEAGVATSEHNLGELNGLRPPDKSRVFAYKKEAPETLEPIISMIVEHDGADAFMRDFGYESLR